MSLTAVGLSAVRMAAVVFAERAPRALVASIRGVRRIAPPIVRAKSAGPMVVVASVVRVRKVRCVQPASARLRIANRIAPAKSAARMVVVAFVARVPRGSFARPASAPTHVSLSAKTKSVVMMAAEACVASAVLGLPVGPKASVYKGALRLVVTGNVGQMAVEGFAENACLDGHATTRAFVPWVVLHAAVERWNAA